LRGSNDIFADIIPVHSFHM